MHFRLLRTIVGEQHYHTATVISDLLNLSEAEFSTLVNRQLAVSGAFYIRALFEYIANSMPPEPIWLDNFPSSLRVSDKLLMLFTLPIKRILNIAFAS